jgi:hypothetical protein
MPAGDTRGMHTPKDHPGRRRIAPRGQIANWVLAVTAGAITAVVLVTRALI